MRHKLTSLSLVAATLLVAAPARPAAAQARTKLFAAEATRPATIDPIVRTVATYHIASARVAGMPFEVSITDSAGTLVGSYRYRGASRARPMLVAVIGTDLVLQGDTPSGVLTLRLDGQNGATSSEITGHWWLESQEGDLRGRLGR